MTNGKDATLQRMKEKSLLDTLETLDILTSPSNSTTNEFQMISRFLQQLVIEIIAKTLSKLEASLLITVYIHYKLCYIFVARTFTKGACDELDKTFRPTLLSRMGISSRTNLNILYASHRFVGFQLLTCYNLQRSIH